MFPAKMRPNERELTEIFKNRLTYWMEEECVRFPNAPRDKIVKCLSKLKNFKQRSKEKNPVKFFFYSPSPPPIFKKMF